MKYRILFLVLIYPFFSVWTLKVTREAISTRPDFLLHESNRLAITIPDNLPAGCEPTLKELVAEDGWLDQMVNPVLTNSAQVSEKYQLYKRVYDCLDPIYADLDQEWRSVHFLANLFVIFASDNGNVWKVLLTTQDSSAINALRDETGIPAPAGYVYLRFFPSRESMPEIVRSVFYDPSIKGVTMMTRYIAILDEKKSNAYERALQAKSLPFIIDHELVHAYINSVLGIEHQNAFPDWYIEGLAIYFSDSSRQVSVVVPYGVLDYGFYKTYSTEEYQQFNDNFEYLENALGRDELLRRIYQTFQSYDAAQVYSGLGFTSEEQFFAEAQAWKKRQDTFYTYLGIGVVVIGMVVVGNLWLWWLRRVTYRNNLPDNQTDDDYVDFQPWEDN